MQGRSQSPPAILARVRLVPDRLEDLDASTLVLRMVASEMTVVLETNEGVAAGEHELVEVTHFLFKLGFVCCKITGP